MYININKILPFIMKSELIEPSRNKKILYILLAAVIVSTILIIWISVNMATSDPIDDGGG